jgi:hypothetical protein
VKTWKMIVVSTLVTLAIGGIYLFSVWKHRQNPGVTPPNDASQKLSDDDLAVVRSFFPAHFEDLQRLEGTSVWMMNGYTMPYYPYVGGHVEFGKPAGLIPPTQKLDVKKIVKAATPAAAVDGVEHRSRQAFVVFALPGSTDLFAVAVGSMDSELESYYTDMLFYYDDPHTIYSHWPRDVWAAIDAHQVKEGMSELQTRMAIGMKMHPQGEKAGDRTVTYEEGGKEWTVTYVKNRATTIETAAKSE